MKIKIWPQPFFKQALVFTCLQYKSFENTVEKGEIARYKQFLLLLIDRGRRRGREMTGS